MVGVVAGCALCPFSRSSVAIGVNSHFGKSRPIETTSQTTTPRATGEQGTSAAAQRKGGLLLRPPEALKPSIQGVLDQMERVSPACGSVEDRGVTLQLAQTAAQIPHRH